MITGSALSAMSGRVGVAAAVERCVSILDAPLPPSDLQNRRAAQQCADKAAALVQVRARARRRGASPAHPGPRPGPQARVEELFLENRRSLVLASLQVRGSRSNMPAAGPRRLRPPLTQRPRATARPLSRWPIASAGRPRARQRWSGCGVRRPSWSLGSPPARHVASPGRPRAALALTFELLFCRDSERFRSSKASTRAPCRRPCFSQAHGSPTRWPRPTAEVRGWHRLFRACARPAADTRAVGAGPTGVADERSATRKRPRAAATVAEEDAALYLRSAVADAGRASS